MYLKYDLSYSDVNTSLDLSFCVLLFILPEFTHLSNQYNKYCRKEVLEILPPEVEVITEVSFCHIHIAAPPHSSSQAGPIIRPADRIYLLLRRHGKGHLIM